MKKLYMTFCALILSACSTSLIGSQTATTDTFQLPDLMVSSINLSMVDFNGRCLSGYQIQTTITNQGTATAYTITAMEMNTGQTFTIQKLDPGESFRVSLTASSPTGMYVINVDPNNTISEINETNNNLSYLSPTPTPVLECMSQVFPSVTPDSNLWMTFPPTLPVSDYDFSLTLTAAPPLKGDFPLSLDILLNTVYRSPDWGEFKLTNGIYYRTPPTSLESPGAYTTRAENGVYYGDINADGFVDAVVILNTQNGGTGHFKELALVLNQNGAPYNSSTIYLGDRVSIESGTVQQDSVTLNMVVQGLNDPLCCASERVVWKFILVDGQLIKIQ